MKTTKRIAPPSGLSTQSEAIWHMGLDLCTTFGYMFYTRELQEDEEEKKKKTIYNSKNSLAKVMPLYHCVVHYLVSALLTFCIAFPQQIGPQLPTHTHTHAYTYIYTQTVYKVTHEQQWRRLCF